MNNLKEFQEDFVLLLELGFIANNLSDANSAAALFIAAELLNPASALPNVGRGYMHLLQLQVSQAETQLNSALQKDPKNETAKALLAFGKTLKDNKQEVSKGVEVIQQLQKSANQEVKKLADTLWNFYDVLVKKTVTPGPAGA